MRDPGFHLSYQDSSFRRSEDDMEWETTPFLTKIQLKRLSKMEEIAERLRKARTL